jgi:hypothetical protein
VDKKEIKHTFLSASNNTQSTYTIFTVHNRPMQFEILRIKEEGKQFHISNMNILFLVFPVNYIKWLGCKLASSTGLLKNA